MTLVIPRCHIALPCVRALPARLILFTVGLLCGAARAEADWIVEPVHTTQDAGWKLFLDLDPSGRPFASYFTSTGAYPIAMRTASGWQETQTIPTGLAFSLDRTGTSYMLNRPGPNYFPALQAIGTPSPIAPIESVQVSENAYLDFDSHNQARVAYIDPVAQRLRSATWNGSNWQVATVATNAGLQYGNSWAAAALDGSDNLHFIYPTLSGSLLYARPVGGSWTSESTGLSGYAYDFKIDPAGHPNLLFNNGVSNELLYGQLTDSGWSVQQLPSDFINSYWAKLVFDSAGQPHVFAHNGNGTESVAHLYQSAGVWHSETIASWVDNTFGPEQIAATIDSRAMHVLFSTGNQQVFYASLAIPEPSTLVLAVFGLVGLAALSRTPRSKRVH